MTPEPPTSRRSRRATEPELPTTFAADELEPDRVDLARLVEVGPDDPSAPSDAWADWSADDPDADVTRQFWGEGPGWTRSGSSRRTRNLAASRRSAHHDGASGLRRRVGEDARGDHTGLLRRTPGAATGSVQRTRTHRVVGGGSDAGLDGADDRGLVADRPRRADRPSPPPSPDVPPDHLPLERATESRPRRQRSAAVPGSGGGIDPLLARLGALVLAGVLLVPLALGLRSAGGDGGAGLRTLAAGETADVLPLGALGRPASGATSQAIEASAAVAAEASDDGVEAAVAAGDRDAAGDSDAAGDEDAEVATDAAVLDDAATGEEVVIDEVDCALEYIVAAGDYWLRLAEESGVELTDVLGANTATIETPLYPGDEICLPEGASMPPPPPTTTPPTTAAPPVNYAVTHDDASASSPSADSSSGSSGSSTPSTTAAPETTAAPAPTTTPPQATTSPTTTAAPAPSTTVPPARANPSAEEVRQMIREVFPEDQHEMAINVARRESTFRANAYNGWCCHGIFQIHWNAHQSWLRTQGIDSPEQLYDARTNIELAYQIYQRSSGWGPWSQTAY